jgi:hypothetical protein
VTTPPTWIGPDQPATSGESKKQLVRRRHDTDRAPPRPCAQRDLEEGGPSSTEPFRTIGDAAAAALAPHQSAGAPEQATPDHVGDERETVAAVKVVKLAFGFAERQMNHTSTFNERLRMFDLFWLALFSLVAMLCFTAILIAVIVTLNVPAALGVVGGGATIASSVILLARRRRQRTARRAQRRRSR